jgi:hypothetical protein
VSKRESRSSDFRDPDLHRALNLLWIVKKRLEEDQDDEEEQD